MAINVGFRHGIYTNEVPSAIVPLTQITTPTVAFGTAPIHLASTPAAANTPVLCQSFAEFVTQFGWSDDFDKYTLCEAAKAHFSLYNVAPVVFVNVLDPTKHAATQTVTVEGVSNPVTLKQPIILGSIKIVTGEPATTKTLIGITDADAAIDIPSDVTSPFTLAAGDNDLTLTTDYTVADGKITLTEAGKEKFDGALTFTMAGNQVTLAAEDFSATRDGDGNTVIKITATNKVVDDKVTITFRAIDPTAVTANTIVGGADIMTGANVGLEVIEDVYPKLGVIPGVIIAPKFSTEAVVAAAMAAKSDGINGCFKSFAIADLSTTAATRYIDAATVKDRGSYASSFLAVTWPKVSVSGEQYHLSTQLAALMCVVDAAHDNIPYKSPSNEYLQIDSAVLTDGTEIYLGRDLANYLNGQGVTTALNFNGWRSWGNYAGAYPSDTDPLTFISVRRMMNWICNTLQVRFFSQIDSPMNRVLIDTVLDSVRMWLNGLTKQGAILGGDIAFLEDDNPTDELTKGNMTFRIEVGFCVPAQKITFTVQFNPDYFSALFE